ncbi:Phosphoglycolate phosphatase [Methylovirgula sp. HY1]|nr:Phosphoglycolate phosphatase [Methylovirgula sp. HY1]
MTPLLDAAESSYYEKSMIASSSTQPLLVFDLDGTLAETAPDLVTTLNMLLTREGFPPVPYEKARGMVGGGARTLIERGLAYAGGDLPAPRIDALFEEFLVHYDAHIADATTLFPGVGAALDRFETAGWRFAVCTNKIEYSSTLLLTALGIADRFHAICGKNTFPMSKPDGRALLMTIDKAGGQPDRTIMVGDSKTDIETAQNAKIPVVAVDFGYTDLPVEAYAPDRVISHFDDLWEAVESLVKTV